MKLNQQQATKFYKLVAGLIESWVVRHQKRISETGYPLNEKWKGYASELGVLEVEKVRVKVVKKIPIPFYRLISWLGGTVNIQLIDIGGMTLGHSIYVVREVALNPRIMAHELVHVAQYEKIGLSKFLETYVVDCITEGYQNCNMEIEAERLSKLVETRHEKVFMSKEPAWEIA